MYLTENNVKNVRCANAEKGKVRLGDEAMMLIMELVEQEEGVL